VCWLDGDRRAARNRQEPSPRKSGPGFLRRRGGTLRGVAVCLCFPAIRETSRGRYQGAPFGVPPPPQCRGGGKLKAHLARRRENADAWLFEIRIGKIFVRPRHIRSRHPEARAQRASKDGRERWCLWPILRGSPLRGERLRMTRRVLRAFNTDVSGIPGPRMRGDDESFPGNDESRLLHRAARRYRMAKEAESKR
jgi:hypothetical protein